jgi:nucleotide-binding universal stress UspA family protein
MTYDPERSMETIVVGVDGSEGGAAALEYAAGEAAFRGARLRVVSAWQMPLAAYGGGFGPPLDQATWDAFGERAQQVADEALEAVKKLQPSLEGEALAVQGHAADVLLEQSADAADRDQDVRVARDLRALPARPR